MAKKGPRSSSARCGLQLLRAPSPVGPALPLDIQDSGGVYPLDHGQRDVRLLLVVVVQVEAPCPVAGRIASSLITLH